VEGKGQVQSSEELHSAKKKRINGLGVGFRDSDQGTGREGDSIKIDRCAIVKGCLGGKTPIEIIKGRSNSLGEGKYVGTGWGELTTAGTTLW